MYNRPSNEVSDPRKLAEVVRRHSFATVVTAPDGVPFASHLPVLFREGQGERGTLVSHMARANPQWRHFADGREALVVFQGPHSYISPTWYETGREVPTWNYIVVHAYGVPRTIDDPDLLDALIRETIDAYESTMERPWKEALPRDFRAGLMRGIVGFEIPVSRFEGKFKLAQNSPPEDQRKLHRVLSASPDPGARELARVMARECGLEPH